MTNNAKLTAVHIAKAKVRKRLSQKKIWVVSRPSGSQRQNRKGLNVAAPPRHRSVTVPRPSPTWPLKITLKYHLTPYNLYYTGAITMELPYAKVRIVEKKSRQRHLRGRYTRMSIISYFDNSFIEFLTDGAPALKTYCTQPL